MAEFCVDCWNRLNETHDSQKAFILSWDQELCEGCGEYKRVIVSLRKSYLLKEAVKDILYRIKPGDT